MNNAAISLENIKDIETKKLVELYNKETGNHIKKFRDRKTAEAKIKEIIKNRPPTHNKPKPHGKRDTADDRIIKLLITKNPKKPKSLSFKKFEMLMEHDGKTVREYKKLEGKYPTFDTEKGWPACVIRWSVNVSHIKLVSK